MTKFEEPFYTFWHGETKVLPQVMKEEHTFFNNSDHPYFKLKKAIQQEVAKANLPNPE